MTDVLLRPEAEADIEEIADYTIERWGREQARSYVAALRADIASLSESSERFPVHEQTGLGLRRMGSGHHLVFYLVGAKVIEVVRVLHERRDPTRELY
jgi:toxin ParE1/3/4